MESNLCFTDQIGSPSNITERGDDWGDAKLMQEVQFQPGIEVIRLSACLKYPRRTTIGCVGRVSDS